MAEGADLELPTEEQIDQMKFGKLTRLLQDLGMTEEETEDLEKDEARAELKKRIRDLQATVATRRRPGQAAENLSEILNTHNAKGQHLAELCHNIAAYLPNLDNNNKDNLKTQFDRAAEDILADVQTLLHKEECPILVAGETSSGKSTFLNLLLGGEILPVAHMSSTSTICEVKYGENKQAVVHLRKSAIAKFFGQKTVTIPLDSTEERQAELKSYMHLEGASRDSLPPAEKIEIFWPLPLLKVTRDNTVKLADFGLTMQEDKITGTVAGTPLYAAPEVKERKVYDKSADIYSLGLILWEMWYGVPLYGLKFCQDSTYAKHMEDDLRKGRDIRMPKWAGAVPPIPEWTRLIHDCLKKDPKERPKIQECLDRIAAMKV